MDKALTITMIVVFLAAIVIIMYFLFFKKQEEKCPENMAWDEKTESCIPLKLPNGDEDPPPGYMNLKFDKTVSYTKSIYWNLDTEYYGTLIFGNVRIGGAFGTNIKIYIKSDGRWKHIGTVRDCEPGPFYAFELPLSMKFTEVKWRAEQTFMEAIFPRYLDEVHAQLMVEI